jgi:hypothetical protein
MVEGKGFNSREPLTVGSLKGSTLQIAAKRGKARARTRPFCAGHGVLLSTEDQTTSRGTNPLDDGIDPTQSGNSCTT